METDGFPKSYVYACLVAGHGIPNNRVDFNSGSSQSKLQSDKRLNIKLSIVILIQSQKRTWLSRKRKKKKFGEFMMSFEMILRQNV